MIDHVDPFDLPDWLAEDDVVWCSDAGLRGARVRGAFESDGHHLPADLMGVDEAFPLAVADPETRLAAHRAWRHGQVLVGRVDDRLLLLVPTRDFGADLVLEAVARFARAVGADPASYSARLRLDDRRH